MKNRTRGDNFEKFITLESQLFEKQAEKNLKKAETYLDEVRRTKDAFLLENGKVIYVTLQPGNGCALNSTTEQITIRYTLLSMQGEMLSKREKVTCTLDELMPAFSKSLLGMLPGEVRRVYIHPDLAYGKLSYLHANSPFIAEVTLLPTDTKEFKK